MFNTTCFFFCKQKTAYEMRISDWSSDVCSSDLLTRSDDRYLVLRERFQIARRLKADLFISVHCDSADNPDATGATVYTLSEVASDKEAARLAARENRKSEERRVGKEGVITCRFGGSQEH